MSLTRNLSAFALVLLLFTVPYFGCALNPSDGDPDPTPTPEPTLERGTPADLVTKYLPAAYSQMDSIAYEAALDEPYLFELAEAEVDPEDPIEWWEKFDELKITGNMFNARYNDHGQRVERITLSMSERSTAVDNTNYIGKPPDETWYKVTALVDLLVVVEDPDDNEGVINFIVASDQIFTCRPDPDADSLWVVYKQVDQEPIN